MQDSQNFCWEGKKKKKNPDIFSLVTHTFFFFNLLSCMLLFSFSIIAISKYTSVMFRIIYYALALHLCY